MNKILYSLLVCISGVVLWSPPSASACSIPVFQYAMERWAPEDYQLIILSKGELDEKAKAAISAIGKTHANITIQTVNISQGMPGPYMSLVNDQDLSALPCALLLYPDPVRAPRQLPPAWKGRFDADVLSGIVSSPARTEIASRLLRGESAVWVFLESGDTGKDSAAWEVLCREMARLKKELKRDSDTDATPGKPSMPPGPTPPPPMMGGKKPVAVPPPPVPPADPNQPPPPAPVKIDFSAIRVSTTNTAERFLIAMLNGSEPKGAKDKPEPVVFPVFGRGRALNGLRGAVISPENITAVGAFLIGDCSCVVKAENPGVDLLINSAWEEAEPQHSTAALPSLPSLAPPGRPPAPPLGPPLPVPPAPAPPPLVQAARPDKPAPPVTIPEPGPPAPDKTSGSSPLWRNLFITVVLLLAAAAIAGSLTIRKKNQSQDFRK